MIVVETERLRQRRLTADDAAFVMELVNEPAWLRFIGDRGVRSLDDARAYITKGPVAMYARNGFGLLMVERKEDGAQIGMCGLIKRDGLDDVDIGFAFLPRYWGKGYALESAMATLDHGRNKLGLQRIVAIVAQDNEPSIRLLERMGLRFEKLLQLRPEDETLKLYATP